MHKGVQTLVRGLNRLYRELPALHQRDCEAEGFEWLELHDSEQSVLVFMRRADAAPDVVVACNFTPVPRYGYRVGVPLPGYSRERLNTDAGLYGGANIGNGGGVLADDIGSHGRPHSLALTLPPLGTVILERQPH